MYGPSLAVICRASPPSVQHIARVTRSLQARRQDTAGATALAEAVTLCGHLGRDPAWLIDLFADTTGGSNVLKVRGGSIAKALGGDFSDATGVDLDLLRKDMRTMLEEARALGAELPVTATTLGVYDRASAEGWGERDGAAVPAYWRSVAARL